MSDTDRTSERKLRLRKLMDRYGSDIFERAFAKLGDRALSRRVTIGVFREAYRAMEDQAEEGDQELVYGIAEQRITDAAEQRAAAKDNFRARAEIKERRSGTVVTSREIVSAQSAGRTYGAEAYDREVEPVEEERQSGGGSFIWGFLLFLGAVVLIWGIAGLLMAKGILPKIDIFYSALGIF